MTRSSLGALSALLLLMLTFTVSCWWREEPTGPRSQARYTASAQTSERSMHVAILMGFPQLTYRIAFVAYRVLAVLVPLTLRRVTT